jgi:hypothetical protein
MLDYHYYYFLIFEKTAAYYVATVQILSAIDLSEITSKILTVAFSAL